jgi:hypothetical protein
MNRSSTKTLKTPGTVSVVLPVMNETWSLEETIRILADENQSCLEEILIVTSPLITKESLQTMRIAPAGLASLPSAAIVGEIISFSVISRAAQ